MLYKRENAKMDIAKMDIATPATHDETPMTTQFTLHSMGEDSRLRTSLPILIAMRKAKIAEPTIMKIDIQSADKSTG